MKLINILLVSFALLFLAGCAATDNVIKETNAADEVTLKSLEVMVLPNTGVNVANENVVQLYLTNGGFSPAVIEAKVGQNIIVTSYYVDNVHFSIYDLGVEEPLQEADTFEFIVEEAGEFPYICLDCSPMLKGLLVVS